MERQTVNIAYHYTSLEVFLKMLEEYNENNKVINFHGSYISCMNDPLELKYGFRKVMEILPSIENRLQIHKDDRLSQIIASEEVIENFIKHLNDHFKLPFVVCFSNHKDYLPQWEMYGNHGKGLSLGLDIQNYYKVTMNDGKKVLDMTHFFDNQLRAIRVSYKSISKRHLFISALNLFYSDYKIKIEQEKDIDRRNILKVQTLNTIVFLLSSLIKHKAYSYESETRILYPCKCINDIKYKTNSMGNIVPYMNIGIELSRLRKIVVGPRCDFVSAKLMLDTLFHQLGIKHIQIVKSKIPYR